MFPGGDLIAMRETIAALQAIGVDATAERGRADLYHVMHCNFGWARENITYALEQHTPYVVTPVFYPDDSLGLDFTSICGLLEGAEVVLPFSYREAGEIQRLTGYSGSFVPIPNGTSERFHGKDNASEEGWVVSVCARYPDKQVDVVEHVCADLHVPFFCASGRPHEEMPDIYRRSYIYINASVSERMSLSTAEALCAGCRVVDTTENRGNEWYGQVVQCSPWSPGIIRAAIEYAYHEPKWNFRPNQAAREWTWARVAARLKEVYAAVLAAHGN